MKCQCWKVGLLNLCLAWCKLCCQGIQSVCGIRLCRDHTDLLACLVIPSVAVCRFSNTGDEWYVLVGVAKDLILNPRSVAGGFVYTYKLVNSGEKLEFLHKVRGMTVSFTGRVLE